MSAPTIALALDDQALEEIARRVAALLPAPAVDPLYSVAEAAEYLRCKRQRIYDLHAQGRVSACRDGARLLFRKSVLDAFVEGQAS